MKSKKNKCRLIAFTPIATSVLLSMPLLCYADNLSTQNGVTTIVNGVAIIDINAANGNGISHNIYEDLNVDRNGLIFNNSQQKVTSVLAGNIEGNKNLSAGTAKVILNEVASKKQSMLNGMMEVAGDKAHLIIANPNGITMQGGGFINTEKATLTTGKPDIENGKLKGYSVNGGIVNVQGLQSASPTEILARAVVINGGINTEKLSVVAGNNYVNTNAEVMGEVKAQGGRNSYGIDVSNLGGMYANRIKLISTESGVGVRNAGIIAAGGEGIKIDSSGKLINSNAQMKSLGAIDLNVNGIVDNVTGSVVSQGKIHLNTNKNTVNNTRAGNILSGGDIYIESGTFDNTHGKVAAGGLLAINTNNKTLTNTGKGNSVGLEGKRIALQTGTFKNSDGQMNGGSISAYATSINNSKGTIEAEGNIELDSNVDVDNSKGLIRTKSGYIQIAAGRTLTNSNNITADAVSADSLGILAGDGGIRIIANTLDNRKGKMASSGNIDLESRGVIYNIDGQIMGDHDIAVLGAGTINNTHGKIIATDNIMLTGRGAIDNSSGAILSDKVASVTANSFDNSTYAGFVIGNKGVNIDVTGTFNNHIGVVRAEQGDIEMTAHRLSNNGGMILGQNIKITSASALDNSYGLMVADKQITLRAVDINNSHGESFGSIYGKYFNISAQPGGIVARDGIEVAAKNFNNDYSRVIAENGPLTTNIDGTLSSTHALLVGGGDITINAQKLYNNYSTIYSGGNLSITTSALSNYSSGSLNDSNATGVIAAEKIISLNIGSNFINYGWLSGKENSVINTDGYLINYNTINSEGNLAIATKGTLTNYGDIAAATALNVITDSGINNTGGSNISGKETFIEAKDDIINHGNIVADDRLTINAQRYIYNYSNMYTNGEAEISAKTVNNSGGKSLLGGQKGLHMSAGKVNSSGRIVGL